MPKGPNGEKRPSNPIEAGIMVARIAVGDLEEEYADQKKPAPKGGKKGGKARAKTLTPERRSEIASKAAKVRWGGDKEVPDTKLVQKRRNEYQFKTVVCLGTTLALLVLVACGTPEPLPPPTVCFTVDGGGEGGSDVQACGIDWSSGDIRYPKIADFSAQWEYWAQEAEWLAGQGKRRSDIDSANVDEVPILIYRNTETADPTTSISAWLTERQIFHVVYDHAILAGMPLEHFGPFSELSEVLYFQEQGFTPTSPTPGA